MLQKREFPLGAQKREHAGNRLVAAGNGAVDPFGGEQDRTADAALRAKRKQRLAEGGEPFESREVVERGDEEACVAAVALSRWGGGHETEI